jgi:hypothetical protein
MPIAHGALATYRTVRGPFALWLRATGNTLEIAGFRASPVRDFLRHPCDDRGNFGRPIVLKLAAIRAWLG